MKSLNGEVMPKSAAYKVNMMPRYTAVYSQSDAFRSEGVADCTS